MTVEFKLMAGKVSSKERSMARRNRGKRAEKRSFKEDLK
jgi:hypothetical protein